MTANIEGDVDNARMRQIYLLHATDVTRLLQSLVAKGALEQVGQGRWSRYRIANAGQSVHIAGDSVHKSNHSEHKPDDSIHKPTYSEYSAELLAIAAKAQKHERLPPEETEFIILQLCQGRWLTRNQLADLMNRNPDGLRARFLTAMVAHQRLRYPDANVHLLPL